MSEGYSKTVQWLVWGFLAIVIAVIAGLFVFKTVINPPAKLPVYNQVAEFTLTNQLGGRVTLASLRGNVWVANIIFTRCAGPCPKLTAQTRQLQDRIPRDLPVKLVTLTTDPEYDSPQVLKMYANRNGADPNRWYFLTGSKAEIVKLAVDGLKLTRVEKKPEERDNDVDLFIHSTIWVLVDKRGQLRATFESTDPEAAAKILSDIHQLIEER